MSADDDVKLQSIEDIMSSDGPIDLFATDDRFQKAASGKKDPYHKNRDKKTGEEIKKNGRGFGTTEDKPIINMNQQEAALKKMSKKGTPLEGAPTDKNIPFDPASGEAMYWRDRNFPANQQDMAKFSKRIRSGEYLPIYIDGDDIVIGSAGGEKERHPIKDYEENYGSIASLLESNKTPATWKGMTIIGAIPAKQYEQGILPQILATSGSGKARGELRGQDYDLDDKSSFDNYTVFNYLKNLIRGEDGNGIGSDYYANSIGDMINPKLLQSILTMSEDEKAGLSNLSDDELAIKYPGVRRDVADMISRGGISTTDMDSLSGLTGNQFRDALGKLALKSRLSREFGDKWQNLKDTAAAEDATRSDKIQGGRKIGDEYHDPSEFLDVDSMIDYLTSDVEAHPNVGKEIRDFAEENGITPSQAAALRRRQGEVDLENKGFLMDKIREIAEKNNVPLWMAKDMFDQYEAGRVKDRAEEEAKSAEWAGKQLSLDKAGTKADDTQSKAQKTAAEYFGDDKDTIDRLNFKGDDIQTLKNFRDKHNTSINSAIQKLMRLHGGQLPDRYRVLAGYADKPLYGKVGGQFPDIDKELVDLISGGADYESAAGQIGSKYRTRNMAQVLNLLRQAMNEPGNEDLLRKYNESRGAQSARDFNEMFKPKNQREEDIIKAYQEAYRNALGAGHDKESAQALALEEVNRKQSNLAHGEELPLTPEMIKRMVTSQNQYLTEQQAATQAEDAAEHAKIGAMNTATGEEQPHAFAPTKEEAVASAVANALANKPETLGQAFKRKAAQYSSTPVAPKMVPGNGIEVQEQATEEGADVEQVGGSDDTPASPKSKDVKQKTDDSEPTKEKESENTKTNETKEPETKEPEKKQENVVIQGEHGKAFTKSIADIMDEDDLNLAEAMYIRTPYNLVVMQTGEPMKIEAPSETKGSEEHHVKNKMPSINDLMDN